MRESIVTICLFYELETFGTCFARLETKLNARYMLHHCELSQRSALYKILNTTENECQERSDEVTGLVQGTRRKGQLIRVC
jgi:hypothetical protein